VAVVDLFSDPGSIPGASILKEVQSNPELSNGVHQVGAVAAFTHFSKSVSDIRSPYRSPKCGVRCRISFMGSVRVRVARRYF